jgi:hypothetical protein
MEVSIFNLFTFRVSLRIVLGKYGSHDSLLNDTLIERVAGSMVNFGRRNLTGLMLSG